MNISVPWKPDLGGHFKIEPIPPEIVAVSDPQGDFRQFADRSDLIPVGPVAINGMCRTKGLSYIEINSVKVATSIIEPNPR